MKYIPPLVIQYLSLKGILIAFLSNIIAKNAHVINAGNDKGHKLLIATGMTLQLAFFPFAQCNIAHNQTYF